MAARVGCRAGTLFCRIDFPMSQLRPVWGGMGDRGGRLTGRVVWRTAGVLWGEVRSLPAGRRVKSRPAGRCRPIDISCRRAARSARVRPHQVNMPLPARCRQGLERRPDPQVPDGQRPAGEAAHPHGRHPLPRVQERRGQLRLQGRQNLQGGRGSGAARLGG